jgi:predicted nucleic acid-binding protein
VIVVDASLLVDALTDDGEVGAQAREALVADPHWVAPDHLRVEATSAIRGRWLGGKLADARADMAVRALNQLTVTYAPWEEVAERAWELRHNATPYDAAYLALAEVRGCPVVTTDRKLLGCSARRCQVEVVGRS